jgi:hypothetical protein
MSQIITKDLRELLKLTLQEEIENLPSYLQTLNEKDRLNIIIKLMPFVFPKIEKAPSTIGEPFLSNW